MSLSDDTNVPAEEIYSCPPTAEACAEDEVFEGPDPDAIELCTHTATTRVERWKNRLLDLTLRNTLLNFNARAAVNSSLRFIVHDVCEFENALVGEDAKFEIRAAEELSGNAEIAGTELAREIFPQKRLLAEPPPLRSRKTTETERIRDRLVKIFRTSNTAVAETGANTLFVALGFLRWQCSKRPGETLLAPLVLIPAKLERSRGELNFSLRASDEDVRLNLTLAEMLRQEFGIVLPELENALPEDESGIDMAEVFRIFREAVAGRDGFGVEESCALGNFSFAKYLMWRDLQERPDVLARSRIVSHLMDETRSPFAAKQGFIAPKNLDRDVGVGNLFCPLSADSSQLSAVCAATAGKNFILVGPPGTGKSQTIANLITHALANDKTVLFVAEKSAALDVVFRRLKKIGIGDFCLELHSDKTNKRAAYEQFAASLELASGAVPAHDVKAHEALVAEAQTLRDTLAKLPKILHEKRQNGLSLAEAVGVICAGEGLPEIELRWERGSPATDTQNMRERKMRVAAELAEKFAETQGCLARAAGKIASPTWSQGWQRKAEHATKALRDAAEKLDNALVDLTVATGLLPASGTLVHQKEWLKLTEALLAVRGEAPELVLGEDAVKNLETLRSAAVLADNCARHKSLLSLPYAPEAADDPGLEDLLKTWREAEISWVLPRWLKRRKVIRALRVLADGTQSVPLDPRVDLGNLIAIRSCKKDFAEKYTEISAAFPSLIKNLDSVGVIPRIAALEKARMLATAALEKLESVPEKREAWCVAIRRWVGGKDPAAAPGGAIPKALEAANAALVDFTAAQTAFEEAVGTVLGRSFFESLADAVRFAEEFFADHEAWRNICDWNGAALAAERRGMTALTAAVRAGEIAPEKIGEVFEVNYCRDWAEAMFDSEPLLLEYTAGKNLSRIGRFRTVENALRDSVAKVVRNRLIERSRSVFDKKASAELSLLRHEIEKRRAHLPIRRFLARAPKISRVLKPCLLTSPLSAAQYLELSATPFDLVVFDEASQISVWDSVGALARGKSAVIVGDPKQLPPTSFFQSTKGEDPAGVDANSAAKPAVPADAESVLDECRACGVPAMNLTWHYRSRAETLIAFSNSRYYSGKLMTFPAPKTHDRSLEYVFCENGIYAAGSSRTNAVEARALVERVIEELSRPDFEYNEFSSIGVVTFNAQQQALICKLFDEALETKPALRKYFSEEEVSEPVFVKNLENVQGDERGVIYFSTTFGPDADGDVGQNFGPLNRDGGERRLNVAITRSRAGMRVFTSLRPGDIRTSSGGMSDLRDFLEFARSGALTSVAARNASANEAAPTAKKSIEDALAASLEARGWKCLRSVGFSGMRIDIAVVHPEREEEFLAAILCDGAESMVIPTVRDREILREEVLRGLGWNVLRAWALDRWLTPELSVSRIDSRLRRLLEEQKPKSDTEPEACEATVPAATPEPPLAESAESAEPAAVESE